MEEQELEIQVGFHLDLQGIIISPQPPKCVALSIFDHDLEPYMEGQAFFKAAARLGSELEKKHLIIP